MNQIEQTIMPRGRPREFCLDAALAKALRIFWSKGFEGSSMSDLTEAMGITRPSLYAAFGNKEGLFRKALELYEREKLAYVDCALSKPTSREVAEALLRGSVMNATAIGEPPGCLEVNTSAPAGDEARCVREEVLARSDTVRAALVARLVRAKADKDLPGSVDPDGLASLLFALMQGISLQAASGTSREDLDRLVDTGLNLWPSK